MSTELVAESSLRSFNTDAYFQADFRLANRLNVYERTVYNVLDMFGDVGGVLEIIMTSSGFLVSLLAGKMFLASLIRELFRVRTDSRGADMHKLFTQAKTKNRNMSFVDDI